MEGTQVCNKKDLTPRKLEQNELTRFLKKTSPYVLTRFLIETSLEVLQDYTERHLHK
jgi:hypothetical protein